MGMLTRKGQGSFTFRSPDPTYCRLFLPINPGNEMEERVSALRSSPRTAVGPSAARGGSLRGAASGVEGPAARSAEGASTTAVLRRSMKEQLKRAAVDSNH